MKCILDMWVWMTTPLEDLPEELQDRPVRIYLTWETPDRAPARRACIPLPDCGELGLKRIEELYNRYGEPEVRYWI